MIVNYLKFSYLEESSLESLPSFPHFIIAMVATTGKYIVDSSWSSTLSQLFTSSFEKSLGSSSKVGMSME